MFFGVHGTWQCTRQRLVGFCYLHVAVRAGKVGSGAELVTPWVEAVVLSPYFCFHATLSWPDLADRQTHVVRAIAAESRGVAWPRQAFVDHSACCQRLSKAV